MNINRNNYEEFFLLYIDGELTADDAIMVETFVEQNPDLSIELSLLKETVLPLSNIEEENEILSDKSFLFKQIPSEKPITAEETADLLLLLDNELPQVAVQQLQMNLHKNAALNTEWQLLQQTKLPLENIVHPNKTELYQKQPLRIIPFGWRRMAVAAAVTVLVGSLWLLSNNEETTVNTEKQLLANVNKQPIVKHSQSIAATGITVDGVSVGKSTNQTTAAVAKTGLPTQKTVSNVANKPLMQKNANNTIFSPSEVEQQNQNAVVNSQLIAANTQIEGNNSVNTNSIAVAEKNTIATTVSSENFEKPVTNTYTASYNNTNKPIAQSTVYRELETEDEQKNLYVGFVALNKDKLRGVTRKLGSLFGKKAKKDPEDLKDVMVYN